MLRGPSRGRAAGREAVCGVVEEQGRCDRRGKKGAGSPDQGQQVLCLRVHTLPCSKGSHCRD